MTNKLWLGVYLSFVACVAPVTYAKPTPLIEVGRTQMSWLFWDLYQARLLTEDGEFTWQKWPMTLEITYLRDIEAAHLIEATAEQWQHLQVDEEQQQVWLTQLQQVWPDVSEGDSLTFVVDKQGVGQFFYNQQPIDWQSSAEFSQQFLAIWLSPQSSELARRAELIGEK